MIWTVMPLEHVVEQTEPVQTEQIVLDGRQVLVAKFGESRVIHRLLSTNAADYLDPRFMPGRVLETRRR